MKKLGRNALNNDAALTLQDVVRCLESDEEVLNSCALVGFDSLKGVCEWNGKN